jgi:hypothetical protein
VEAIQQSQALEFPSQLQLVVVVALMPPLARMAVLVVVAAPHLHSRAARAHRAKVMLAALVLLVRRRDILAVAVVEQAQWVATHPAHKAVLAVLEQHQVFPAHR